MSVRVETTDRAVTAFGGAELLREAARAVGLAEVLRPLSLKKRARGLSDAQFVLSIAESVALGASCLDDLAVARADPVQTELRGFPVPAPQTAGAWLRRVTRGHVRQLDTMLARAQRNAYLVAGVSDVTLDFDSTYVFSRSRRRQGVDRTWKKGYALHPMLCFDAESGAAVHARLRRGRPGAAPAPRRGISTFVSEALRAVPDGVSVRACFDSGFYSGALLAQLEAAGVTYLCGVPLAPRSCAPQPSWTTSTGRPVATKRVRWPSSVTGSVTAGLPAATSSSASPSRPAGRRASGTAAIGTGSSSPTTGSAVAAELEEQHRQKATVETGMAELKSNFGPHAFRKHGFMANWAWLLLVCLGNNLCCWAQHLGHLGGGRDHGELRAKRLRYRYLAVPAVLVRSGRRSSCAFAPAIRT